MRNRNRIAVKSRGGVASLLTAYFDRRLSFGIYSQSPNYADYNATVGGGDAYEAEEMTDELGPKTEEHYVSHRRVHVSPANPASFERTKLVLRDQYTSVVNGFSYVNWYEKWMVIRYQNTGYTGSSSTIPSFGSHVPAKGYNVRQAISSIIREAADLKPDNSLAESLAEITSVTHFADIAMSLARAAKSVPKMRYSTKAKKYFLKRALRDGTGHYVATVWGLLPIFDGIKQAMHMVDSIQKRFDRLQRRTKPVKMNRRWTETYTEDGTEMQTTYTVSCDAVPPVIIPDPGPLLAALFSAEIGLTQIGRTLWALAPLSFAVDAFLPQIREQIMHVDANAARLALSRANIIKLPSEWEVATAKWTMSAKTIAKMKATQLLENRGESVEVGSDIEQTSYTRTVMDLSEYTIASTFGLPPKWGLVGSLGALAVHLRLK